jgi:hypothetical protein
LRWYIYLDELNTNSTTSFAGFQLEREIDQIKDLFSKLALLLCSDLKKIVSNDDS